MRYEHTPRPLIEDHYHIKELIERQEKRSNDRTYHKDKQKEKEERDSIIKDSKILTLTDFYCSKCQKDFKSQAIKQVEQDWTNTTQSIAFYKTKCFKSHWCIRLITDKYKDGFFVRSKLLAKDRGLYYNDIVQPYESGYKLLYGNKNN